MGWVRITARVLLVVMVVGGVGLLLPASGSAGTACIRGATTHVPAIGMQSFWGKFLKFLTPFLINLAEQLLCWVVRGC